MDVNELQKLMDCCRSDEKDLVEPELAALQEALGDDPAARREWKQHQAWEEEVRSAMHDVSVPSGLKDRLLTALHSARPAVEPSAAKEPMEAQPSSSRDDRVEVAEHRRHWLKRWPVWAAGTVAAAAAFLFLASWIGIWGDPLTGVQVAQWSRQWIRGLDEESWQAKRAPVERFPMDPGLPFRFSRWQSFRALNNAPAVAYMAEMAPDHSRAFLLVIRTRSGSNLSEFPPIEPNSTTQGTCIGVWKSRGYLYVLFVPGSRRHYRQLMNTHPLA